MRSKVIVAAAAAAAALPLGLTATSAAAAVGTPDTLDVANNWCAAPVRLLPLSTNALPGEYRVCDDLHAGGNGGVYILNNLCVAPIEIGDAPYLACDDETTDGPPTVGPVTVLRNLSVLGTRLTP